MKLNGAEITIKLLEQRITIMAGIPGGANLPLYDALFDSNIRHILARHEQGAGFIAHGIARTTGQAGVCLATSGPGATNVLTAIADAYLDSIPMITITGQVPTGLIGSDAFQEVDTYGMTIPITKHNFLARSARELLTIIPEAFRIAETGRPGPVCIDIPKDVQKEIIEIDEEELTFCSYKEQQHDKDSDNHHTDSNTISKIAEAINSAKRPLLYVGGGAVQGDSYQLVRELSDKGSIPVTSTLMGLGVAEPNVRFLGMLGMHGERYTNTLLDQTDLLIALGSRFDDRATGEVTEFCKNASIVHIDIDDSQIGKIKEANISLKADLSLALTQLVPLIKESERKSWYQEIIELKEKFPEFSVMKNEITNPEFLIKEIGRLAENDAIITTDVGQHQMWVAKYYPFCAPRTFLTSGGLGTMGFGLPTAIGAALAHPEKCIICFTGDGSILMNIQELATLNELQLNVKIVLLNNQHLGLVRQQQELFYNKRFIGSQFNGNPDFTKTAAGFGIEAITITDTNKMELNSYLNKSGPCLIEIPIDPAEMVFPMVAPGSANRNVMEGKQ